MLKKWKFSVLLLLSGLLLQAVGCTQGLPPTICKKLVYRFSEVAFTGTAYVGTPIEPVGDKWNVFLFDTFQQGTMASGEGVLYPDNWSCSNAGTSPISKALSVVQTAPFSESLTWSLSETSGPWEISEYDYSSDASSFVSFWNEIINYSGEEEKYYNFRNLLVHPDQNPESLEWTDEMITKFLQLLKVASFHYSEERSDGYTRYRNYCFLDIFGPDPENIILGGTIGGVNVAIINVSQTQMFAQSVNVADLADPPENFNINDDHFAFWWIATNTRIHEFIHYLGVAPSHHEEAQGLDNWAACTEISGTEDCLMWSTFESHFAAVSGGSHAGVLCSCCWDRLRSKIN